MHVFDDDISRQRPEHFASVVGSAHAATVQVTAHACRTAARVSMPACSSSPDSTAEAAQLQAGAPVVTNMRLSRPQVILTINAECAVSVGGGQVPQRTGEMGIATGATLIVTKQLIYCIYVCDRMGTADQLQFPEGICAPGAF